MTEQRKHELADLSGPQAIWYLNVNLNVSRLGCVVLRLIGQRPGIPCPVPPPSC